MKYLSLYLIAVCIAFTATAYAQPASKDSAAKKASAKTSFWEGSFWKPLRIGQSMETAEKKEEPAQLMGTFPQKDPSSWLANLGISYALNNNSENSISKLTIEYHRNTLTDKKQKNFSAGYTLYQALGGTEDVFPFLSADFKYVYDSIDTKKSIAYNALVSWFFNGKGFHLNAPNWIKDDKDNKTAAFTPALYAGLQGQHVFNAKKDSAKGYTLRFVYKASAYFDIMGDTDPNTPKPALRFSVDYTGRSPITNSTKFGEDYTDLIKAGVELFITYKPVKVSIGVSYNSGSDPLKGLLKQQYWLLSLNFFKNKS
ncbi:MAG: hypothetical protein JWM28_3428 [Chitinophagaceae bacterium]|nr:hypothetical protein [Chitinophagaceae bacterium]